MLSREELRPCPFCASAATVSGLPDGENCVLCDNVACSTQSPEDGTPEETSASWNRRPIEDALRAELAAIKGELEADGASVDSTYPHDVAICDSSGYEFATVRAPALAKLLRGETQ